MVISWLNSYKVQEGWFIKIKDKENYNVTNNLNLYRQIYSANPEKMC